MTTGSPQGDSSLGEVIRAWRTAYGWTVTELARRTGVSKGYISQVEHGKILQPKLEQLARIANALGITEWDLINRRLPDETERLARARTLAEDSARTTYHRPVRGQTTGQQQVLQDVLQRLRELERIVEEVLQPAPESDERRQHRGDAPCEEK